MSKLSLIVADNKPLFTDIFVNYLTNQHSKRFLTHCYIDKENLENFFLNNDKEVDILLISPELYYDGLENKNIKSIIILSNGRLNKSLEKMKSINRFQSGDIIVGQMLNIFSERNSDLIDIQQGSKMTKIVGVFSPNGGTGKTSIAVASAITCSQRDKNVFYLNLENIPSTQMFFLNRQELNFSHVLYYLKSKKINIGLKIDAIKVLDPIYNINYFPIQENLLEPTEILSEEFELLICNLRNSKLYDIIFIDFSSIIDYKTLKTLSICDEILLVLTQDHICSIKNELFYKELRAFDPKNNTDISAKLILLMNKFNYGIPNDDSQEDFIIKNTSFKIPYIPQLFSMNNGRAELNLSNAFGDEISRLIQRLLSTYDGDFESSLTKS